MEKFLKLLMSFKNMVITVRETEKHQYFKKNSLATSKIFLLHIFILFILFSLCQF